MRPSGPLLVAGMAALLAVCGIVTASKDLAPQNVWAADFGAFTALDPIDTHAHVTKVDPDFYLLLQRLHLHIVDIVVANNTDANGFFGLESKIRLEFKMAAAETFVKESQGRAVFCTTFDPFKFSNPTFAEDVNRQLNADFADGAVAVKIWKNVGMQLKDRSGHFVLPDDPRLEPIYRNIAAHSKTLIAHLAEPDSCWLPLDKNSPDYSYYREFPEWYMYNKPDHPRKAAIIQARDHVLQENPTLRVVGAHLASLETNLDEVGKRLDRYPNLAVDVAARVVYLAIQPHDKAREFILKYQDRILYGTDLSLYDRDDTATEEKVWEKHYARDWAFFSSAHKVDYQGHVVEGLALPPDVLRKLYHDNAVRWIPGVLPVATRLSTSLRQVRPGAASLAGAP